MLSRASAARQLSRSLTAHTTRMYTTDIGRSAGATAQDPGFNKREKAQEDMFIRKHELELLANLRNQIEARKAEIEALKKQEAELAKVAEGKEK